MLLCSPYVWWSSVYEKDLFDKLQFVMAGLEEALTTTIDGIAKLTDKSLWAQYTKDEKNILSLLKRHMGDKTVKQSEFSWVKFNKMILIHFRCEYWRQVQHV